MTVASFELTSGAVVTLVRDPAAALPAARVKDALPEWTAITRSAFENDAIPESDVRIHALEVAYGAYLTIGGRDWAFTSAEIFFPNALPAPVLYLEGTALHRDLQGRGLYWPLTAVRLAVGRSVGCRYVATRTTNPIVCKMLKRFEPYPIFNQEPVLAAGAAEVAQEIYSHHSDYQGQGGCRFDSVAGVQRNAYEGRMNSTLVAVGDADISAWFAEHIDLDAGDALIVVGELDPSSCDPDTERWFGFPFAELERRVTSLIG